MAIVENTAFSSPICYDRAVMPASSVTNPPNRSDVILVSPDRMGGEPVFAGTRVPVRTLFVYLRKGLPIEQFLDDFEGVKPEHVTAVLDWAESDLLHQVRGS